MLCRPHSNIQNSVHADRRALARDIELPIKHCPLPLKKMYPPLYSFMNCESMQFYVAFKLYGFRQFYSLELRILRIKKCFPTKETSVWIQMFFCIPYHIMLNRYTFLTLLKFFRTKFALKIFFLNDYYYILLIFIRYFIDLNRISSNTKQLTFLRFRVRLAYANFSLDISHPFIQVFK